MEGRMRTPSEIRELLEHCFGGGQCHRFSPFAGYPVATDGVSALAEAAGCYWLLDAIGSYQGRRGKLDPRFQKWILEVDLESKEAVLTGTDEGRTIRQRIEYTDFPLEKIELWLIYGVVMLPSEY
jgi:hypothetical protein